MIFRLQVFYCCWRELMEETTKDFPDAQVDLIFSGGSRQHSENCKPLKPTPAPKKSSMGLDHITLEGMLGKYDI